MLYNGNDNITNNICMKLGFFCGINEWNMEGAYLEKMGTVYCDNHISTL